MSGLAESDLEPSQPVRWWLRAIVLLLIVATFGGVASVDISRMPVTAISSVRGQSHPGT